MRIGRNALALGVLVLASACDTGMVPDMEASLAAVEAIDGAIEQAGVMRHGPAGAQLPLLFFPNVDGSRPTCESRDGATRCRHQAPAGNTESHTVTFYNRAGATQSAYDAATTASVRFVIEVSGTTSRDGNSRTVARRQELRATGLLDDASKATWNGSGTSTTSSTRTGSDGQTYTHRAAAEFTVSNVVVPRPRGRDSWPLSGSVTQKVTITGQGPNGAINESVNATVTFNGTQKATLLLNGETREIDLARRAGGHRGPGGRRGGSGG